MRNESYQILRVTFALFALFPYIILTDDVCIYDAKFSSPPCPLKRPLYLLRPFPPVTSFPGLLSPLGLLLHHHFLFLLLPHFPLLLSPHLLFPLTLLPSPPLSPGNHQHHLVLNLIHIYLALKQNPCSSSPCVNDGTCQVGYTAKGFRCKCHPGFTGELCSKGITLVEKWKGWRLLLLHFLWKQQRTNLYYTLPPAFLLSWIKKQHMKAMHLSVIVRESVPEVENVGWTILMKLAPEIGLIEIFQKPSWFCSLTFSSEVTWGVPFRASGTWKILLLKG